MRRMFIAYEMCVCIYRIKFESFAARQIELNKFFLFQMSIKTLLFHVGFVLLQEEKGSLFVARELGKKRGNWKR